MKKLTDEELAMVCGSEGLFYYLAYGAGSVIRELNELGEWIGGEVYEATH